MMVREGPPQWQNLLILHNTMEPSTRQAVEHEAWARGTRGPELNEKDQGARTRGK